MITDLVRLFEQLPTPTASAAGPPSFSALPVPGFPGHHVAKDSSDSPVLLLATPMEGTPNSAGPLALQHITVQHRVTCRVTSPDGDQTELPFSVIRCIGSDHALQVYFLRVLGAIVAGLGPEPSPAAVSGAVARLADLFQALARPARKPVQGLWAELLVIAESRDPAGLVACWHTTPGDRYDFSSGEQRVEVKSSADRTRRHHFSLEQVVPPQGTTVVIASVFVERAGAGASVDDLAQRVRTWLGQHPDLLFRLDEVISATLGADWRLSFEERFDLSLGRDSLAFYRVEAVPKVSPSTPPEVSDVRFRSDLSGLTPLGDATSEELGGIFATTLRSPRGRG